MIAWRSSSNRDGVRLEGASEEVGAPPSHPTVDFLAVDEDGDGGHAHHVVTPHELGLVVGVDGDDGCLGPEPLELAPDGAARAAPRSPEVDDDGAVGSHNDVVECRCG